MITFNLFIVAIMFIAGYILYPQLPAYLPSHWNIQGQIDSYMPKGQALWLFPLITLAMLILFRFLPQLDPKKDKYVHFKHEWAIIQTTFILFFAYIHGITLYAGLKGQVPVTTLVFIGMGILFTLLGNYLSKIRQNYFIGIKVPWTLNSEDNWNKTHRFAAKCFVAAGLLTIADALFLPFAPALIFAAIMLAGFLPIAYSFLLYKNKLGYMKYIYIALGVLLVIVVFVRGVSGEDAWVCQNGQWTRHGNPGTSPPATGCGNFERVIGGDKDIGGCLVGAGYTWCPLKHKCLRGWEEPCQ